jgi:hypothetical protein
MRGIKVKKNRLMAIIMAILMALSLAACAKPVEVESVPAPESTNEQNNIGDINLDDPDSINDGNTDNDNQNGSGEDYGPSWTFNIGGNFDIVSDMVWKSVELQEIIAGGDTFKGYGLKELMEFSGNGSDRATVTFIDTVADNKEVEPTYDAYIVFKRNDEFLNAPFLLSIDGISQYPVMEVHPN